MNAKMLPWWIVWLGLQGAVVIYFFLLKMLPRSETDGGDSWTSLHVPLLVTAALVLAVSFAIRFMITKRFAGQDGPRAEGGATAS